MQHNNHFRMAYRREMLDAAKTVLALPSKKLSGRQVFVLHRDFLVLAAMVAAFVTDFGHYAGYIKAAVLLVVICIVRHDRYQQGS